MKKIATLLLTAGLVFAGVTGASAIDFKAKGQFIMGFELGETAGYGFKGDDSFEAEQRVRLQIDAIASESLSGTVYFEIGETTWGKNRDSSIGGALGTDGISVEVKHAYIDWIVPNTELKIRMGLQALGLPSYTTGTSQVFVHDVAAIVLNNKFNDNVSLTAFWARPFNDNYVDNGQSQSDSTNFLDNVDYFGLVLPMTFNNFNITPWVTYAAVGRNFIDYATVSGSSVALADNVVMGVSNSVGVAALQNAGMMNSSVVEDLNAYGSVWHVGLTGKVSFNNPFTLAWDLNYGSAEFGEEAFSRHGFYGSLLAEYKMDWGTPGLYFWYSTGDDGDISDGSERMPTINTTGGTNGFSPFALNGHTYIGREGVIGNTLIGTWGIGARVSNFSFMEDLSHTFAVNYFNGTNHGENGRVLSNRGANSQAWARNAESGMYLTTEDWALEFSLRSKYKIYENLTLAFEAAYLILDMDDDIWGNHDAHDAWNLNTSFVYSF